MALSIVRLDGLLEAGLGLGLVVAAAGGGLGSADFPEPVGTPVVAGAGGVLLLAGIVLWRAPVTPGLLRGLAAANLVTAAMAVAWLAAARGFSTSGLCLLTGTAAVLVALASAQLRIARRPGTFRRLPETS
jgi:hypothetical protein